MKVYFHLVRRYLREERGLCLLTLAIGAFGAYFGIGEPESLPPAPFMKGAFVLCAVSIPLVWLAGFGAAGRRGFELARPLSAWQICASKLTGVVLSILLAALAAGLPIALFSPVRTLAAIAETIGAALTPSAPLFREMIFDTPPRQVGVLEGYFWSLAFWPLICLVAAALLQTVALAFLAHTRHALLALGALALFVAAFRRTLIQLSDAGALGIGFSWLPFLLVALAGLGVLGAWRSFSRGVLLAPAFRAYSRTMSAGLVVLAGLLLLAGRYAVPRPEIGALLGYSKVVANFDGSLWLIGGYQDRRGFAPLFLAEPATRQATYLAPAALASDLESLARGSALVGFQERTSWPELLLSHRIRGCACDLGRLDMFFAAAGKAPLLLRKNVHIWWFSPFEPTPDPKCLNQLDESGERLVRIDGSKIVVHDVPEGKEIGAFEVKDAGKSPVLELVRRQGSLFDVVAIDFGSQGAGGARFRLDAAIPELRPTAKWVWPEEAMLGPYRGPQWWRSFLELLDAGAPAEEIARYGELIPRKGGGYLGRRGVAPAAETRWTLLDGRGAPTGFLELPHNASPAGEIRPGLLAASFSSREKPCPVYGFAEGCGLESKGDWTTLLVDTTTGTILRTLPGFAAHANTKGDGRVWLVGPYGEPFDLDSAQAEPRRILPWRPRAAAEARR